MANAATKEEIAVIFHAALIGRTDVLKNAISVIQSTCSDEDTIALISQGRVEDGATPLHLAALAGHSDVIRFLLNANANLSIAPSVGTIFLGKKPYDVAVDSAKLVFHVYMFEQIAMGRVESINRLLKGGVPVTIRDGFKLNDTALHWASSFNSIEVARLLLTSGIDVDVVNLEGQTPLHIACKGMNLQIIQLLLSEGSSTKCLDISGRTPKEILPLESDEIEKLLSFPPEPSLTLRNIFLKSNVPIFREIEVEDILNDDNLSSIISGNNSPERYKSNNDNNNSIQSDRFQSTVSKRNSISKEINHDDADDIDIEEYGIMGGKIKSYKRDKDMPLLVLWPPTQKQIRIDHQQQPLMLSSLETILISISCDTIDIFPILQYSGLMDVFEKFHLTSQIKRNSKDSIQGDPKIRFCVDNNLCPGRHCFEITVTSENISILSSDITGGIYALYAFIQLLQLHSKLKMYPDGAMALLISPIILRDYPTVPNRGIMYSFRQKARSSFQIMKEMVEFFSSLRINLLFLVIDSTTVQDANFQVEINAKEEKEYNYMYQNQNQNQNQDHRIEEDEEGKGEECKEEKDSSLEEKEKNRIGKRKGKDEEEEEEAEVIPANIKALDEICDNVCIELVPTVILSSVYQRLSLSLLKSFSHTMICLIFTYNLQSVRAELEMEKKKNLTSNILIIDDIISDSDCEFVCKKAFEEILNTIVITGFSSLTFSCTNWTSKIINPMALANSKGLNAVQRTMDQLCPSSLYLKPVYFAQDFVDNLRRCTQQVVDQGLSLSIFPAFMDSDFIFPSIILKYYCFLHAGLTWNKEAVSDMLRFKDSEPNQEYEIPIDLSILKEVVTLSLLSERLPPHQIGMYEAMLRVLVGEVFFTQLDLTPKLMNTSTSIIYRNGTDKGQVMNYSPDDKVQTQCSLARTERHLWSLLMSPDNVQDSLCPSKGDAASLLRHYRRLLSNSKWKATPMNKGGILMAFAFGSKKEEIETSFGIELDGFFSTIQILSVFCKAIVLARNAYERIIRSSDNVWISFGFLMNCLTPGIKSDIANSLLAALELTSILSKKRFKMVNTCKSISNSQFLSPNASTKEMSLQNGEVHGPLDPVPAARSRYLRQSGPALPALAVLNTISDLLPIPKSIEETLLSIFS